MKAPCKGCEKRYPGCHDKCEGYQAYAKDREQIRANRTKLNNVYYMDKELKQRCSEIMRKRNNRK